MGSIPVQVDDGGTPTAKTGQLINRLLAGAVQALIDCEATTVIGAAPHERTETRTAQRTGSRPRR